MPKIELRPPVSEDGRSVYELVSNCPPLDTNSAYCNLLQCTHFSDTSIIATSEGKTVGFVSGYLAPESPNKLFIWQVAVCESARGKKLAQRMIQHILARPFCRGVSHLETTITGDNKASWALFSSIAELLGATLNESKFFCEDKHFAGEHPTEFLVSIATSNN